jgi:hypothetical protein
VNAAAASRGTTTTPERSPSGAISATPGAAVATTGSPLAMASSGATANPSWREGKA